MLLYDDDVCIGDALTIYAHSPDGVEFVETSRWRVDLCAHFTGLTISSKQRKTDDVWKRNLESLFVK